MVVSDDFCRNISGRNLEGPASKATLETSVLDVST